MTNENDLAWLRLPRERGITIATSHRENEAVDPWTFPANEQRRLGNPHLTGASEFAEVAESDLDEKWIEFQNAHPKTPYDADLWEVFIADLNDKEIGEKGSATLSHMISVTSYEDVAYNARLWNFAGTFRIELGDQSESPTKAFWRTRSTDAATAAASAT